jgi:4-alpha-glucanotransferase
MGFDRRGGVLLHVPSLPGDGGIGTLGTGAIDFLDFLSEADQDLWQICPLGPTSRAHGNSPYQSYSAFAGNPLVLDLDDLVSEGWLTAADLEPSPEFDPHAVDYDAVVPYKRPLLREAFAGFDADATADQREDFEQFCEAEADWLDDYATFRALKDEFDGQSWVDWPDPIRTREADALAEYREELADEIRYRKFCQFCFQRQWDRVKAAADERGIDIVGDMPIYVALDSADVWSNPDLFELGDDGRPAAVAGVPPDMGDSGQNWGNPLYDWDAMQANDFQWWVDRFERLFDLVDVTRLDHFRGFESYWAIPADAASPAKGEWRSAPGYDLFDTLAETFGGLPLLAENLGHRSEAVERLRETYEIPQMTVPLYADWCQNNHMYQPKVYTEDTVAYTSTHDTNTAVGWYDNLDHEQKDCLHYYYQTDGSEINWTLVESVWESDAAFALTQLQDLLGLGGHARFNTPGTATGNWEWRATRADLRDDVAKRFAEIAEQSGR